MHYILGINSNVLTIYNIHPQDSGDYRCVIRNGSGSAYSNYATLAVAGRCSCVRRQIMCFTDSLLLI